MKHGTKKKISRDIRLDTTSSLFAIQMRTEYGQRAWRWSEIVELEPLDLIQVIKEANEWLDDVGRDGSIPPMKTKEI